jgi:hypothetical protein
MSNLPSPNPTENVSLSGKMKKPWYKRTWFLAVVGLFVVGSIVDSFSNVSETSESGTTSIPETSTTMSTTTTPEVLWGENLKTDIESKTLLESVCKELLDDVKSFTKIVDERLPLTDSPSEDAYESADFVATMDWAGLNHLDEFKRRQISVVTGPLASASLTPPTEEQELGFLLDARIRCELSEKVPELLGDINRLDSQLRLIDTRSQNIPWYPKGFDSFDSNIAYRFLKYGSEYKCNLYGAYCWGIEIVAKSGCNNLYAELTIFDSAGRNIGWTNDSATNVRAGEKAVLVFDSFEDGVDKGRLSEVTCY